MGMYLGKEEKWGEGRMKEGEQADTSVTYRHQVPPDCSANVYSTWWGEKRGYVSFRSWSLLGSGCFMPCGC